MTDNKTVKDNMIEELETLMNQITEIDNNDDGTEVLTSQLTWGCE